MNDLYYYSGVFLVYHSATALMSTTLAVDIPHNPLLYATIPPCGDPYSVSILT